MTVDHPLRLHTETIRRMTDGRPLEQQRSGRTCSAPDCRTRLSRYNPSNVCAEHAGWADHPAGGRRRR